jgi:putative transposase
VPAPRSGRLSRGTDSFKTELIADRVWRTRSQLELAVVEYIGWYNPARLHESLSDILPIEHEQQTTRQATTLAEASV